MIKVKWKTEPEDLNVEAQDAEFEGHVMLDRDPNLYHFTLKQKYNKVHDEYDFDLDFHDNKVPLGVILEDILLELNHQIYLCQQQTEM